MTDRQRRATRFTLDGLRLIYDTGEDFWTGLVRNASRTGLFIETPNDLPLGTKLVMMPDGDEADQLPFEVRGVVVRVNELDFDNFHDRTPGLAVRLEGMSDLEREQLHTFLKEHGVSVDRSGG